MFAIFSDSIEEKLAQHSLFDIITFQHKINRIYHFAIKTSKVIQIFPDYFVAEIFPDCTKDRFICEVYNIKK